MAEGKEILKQYHWIETTVVRLKGEEKKREIKQCFYIADGTVQKNPVPDSAPPPQEQKQGRRRSGPVKNAVKQEIKENKIEDLKEHIEKLIGLIKQYVPPEPEKLQASMQAKKVTTGSGQPVEAVLIFSDYLKPGDQLTMTFDTAAKRLSAVSVQTYLDKPDEPVSLSAQFQSLPDGAHFMAQAVVDSKEKNLQIEVTNTGHQK